MSKPIVNALANADNAAARCERNHIPDLWHVGQHLLDIGLRFRSGEKAGDAVLDAWHKAHAFRDERDRLVKCLREAWEIGASHRKPSFEQLTEWYSLIAK